MESVSKIISDTGLTVPDGRAFHRYACSPDVFSELEESLRSLIASGRTIDTEAAGFVFWAAEHIRARFRGGPLTWAFVFDALGLPDDQAFGRDLVDQGFEWWGRQVRLSHASIRMFLYSLMAEGGIPEALLENSGLYRKVLTGLLNEIEIEGGVAVAPWSERIALRWVLQLPQTFQNRDIARLLSDLALSLVRLRAMLPPDLPQAAAEQWLNKHRRAWVSELPLRMTPQIAETLIRPALRAERASPAIPGPLSKRELRRDETGHWHGYMAFKDDGWLPAHVFPNATGLRLRLIPAGTGPVEGLSYSATPEDGGWRLRRSGSVGKTPISFSPYEPFALAAFADGRAKGEAVIDAGLPTPAETPCFWQAANQRGATAERLTPLPGAGRTQAPCLWALMPEGMTPDVDGLSLDELEYGPDGFLWRISGKGTLCLGEKRYRIETQAEAEGLEARLIPSGETFRGWRLEGNTPIYRGEVNFYGQLGASTSRLVPDHELRRSPGRLLGSEIVEWVRNAEVLARLRLISLPATMFFKLWEDTPGRVVFAAEGLEYGWRARLQAGEAETGCGTEDGTIQLTLETPGVAPGLVHLRLSDLTTGAALKLQAPWPVRKGMILDPEGMRLDRNKPMAVESLYGWRVITPEGRRCDLEIHLTDQRPISLPIAGEGSLAAHLPLIRAMLAQSGPDAQLNLRLVVDGQESNRLEIRRYHHRAVVDEGVLRAGLGRDERIAPETTLATQLNKRRKLTFHAVNVNRPEQVKTIEATASVDLREFLGEQEDPWLIQSWLEGQAQRSVVWPLGSVWRTSRDDRIKTYAQEWERLVSAPEDQEWNRLWRLIRTAGEGGDAGALDQAQALAKVPAAVICLALRIPLGELAEVRDLDTVTPIFWPALPVTDFTKAVESEYKRQLAKFSSYFEKHEATEQADEALVKRVGKILTLQPELAVHFGKALVDTGLFSRLIIFPEYQEMLKQLFVSSPLEHLTAIAQEAVKRFDRLPDGVHGLEPLHRPADLSSFDSYVQQMIDAPFVVAEMAAGCRPAPRAVDKLALISLRLVDPIYFDTALPAALALYLRKSNT